MRKILLLSMLSFLSVVTIVAQSLSTQMAAVEIGIGSFNAISSSRSYGLSYGRHLKSGVYALAGWTQTQGSNTLSDIIGDLPPVSDELKVQFVSVPEIKSDVISNTTLYIGLQKAIQLGQDFFIRGNFALARSTTRRQYVAGIPDDVGTLEFLDELYPVYEQYNSLGARVGLSGTYLVKDYLTINFGANFLSSPNSTCMSVGASTWF